jgi:N-formylglutamate amidohydrolase
MDKRPEPPDSRPTPGSCVMLSKDLFPLPHEILAPKAWHAPAVFNSPHSGALYPRWFLGQTRLDAHAIRRSEDCFVDELFLSAVRCGAPMLRMHVPRAYIDVNREPYELDARMYADALPAYANSASVRVIGGLGTIPRIVCEGEEIYRAPLAVSTALERIDAVYRPYHQTLGALVDKAHRAFGSVLLVDCHSMPSSSIGPAQKSADIVLGDRHGAACAPEISVLFEHAFARRGFRVLRNKPYAGGFITQNYASPGFGRHAIQIEINRALYMNERTLERTRGFGALARALEGILAEVLANVEELFSPARLAAE